METESVTNQRNKVMPNKPFHDVFIDPCPKADRGPLENFVRAIRPEWRDKEINTERFPEGICNTVLKCFADDEEDAVVVRINGEKVKIFPMQCDKDRSDERKVYQLFCEIGVSPLVLGNFKNGLCMQYIRGKTYTWRETYYESSDDPFIRTNMKELVRYHSNRTAELAKEMGFPYSPAIIEHSNLLLDSLKDLEQIPDWLDRERLESELGRNCKEMLKEELKDLIQRCKALNLPIVFCHGDVNATNIIYNSDKNVVKFVDYESAGFNYAAFELARHIYLIKCSNYPDIDDRIPTDDFIRNVIRVYLEERSLEDDSPKPDDEMMGLWYLHVRWAMLLVFHWQTVFSLNWVTNHSALATGDAEKDNWLLDNLYRSCISRNKHYWIQKEEVYNMSIPPSVNNHRALKSRI